MLYKSYTYNCMFLYTLDFIILLILFKGWMRVKENYNIKWINKMEKKIIAWNDDDLGIRPF